MVNVPSYLSRIAHDGAAETSIENLRALHRAHLYAVPFENLDIALGRTIVADEDRILNKIVNLRRGGFCYELNCAFAALLQALGFRVTLLSARVARTNGGEGPEFDHLTLRVDLEESWLADVGFGESFLEPLRLRSGIEQIDPAGRYRLLEEGGRWYMQQGQPDGNWKAQYSFDLQERHIEDFAGMCHFHQTSPDSSFTKKRVCTMAAPSGRVTLSEMNLIVTTNGVREERELASEEERTSILRERFGVALN